MKRKIYTKKPQTPRSFRLPKDDVELWQIAAGKLEISQSEFARQAIRDKAQQVLTAR